RCASPAFCDPAWKAAVSVVAVICTVGADRASAGAPSTPCLPATLPCTGGTTGAAVLGAVWVAAALAAGAAGVSDWGSDRRGSAASAAIIFGSVASLSPAGISSAAGSALKLVWPASFAASGNAAGKILPVSIAVLAALAAAGAAWSAEVCSSAACSSVGIVSEADRPLSNSAKPAAALVSALSTGRPPALSGGSAVEMSSEEEAEVSIGPSVHHDLLSSIQGPCQLASPPAFPAASPAR